MQTRNKDLIHRSKPTPRDAQCACRHGIADGLRTAYAILCGYHVCEVCKGGDAIMRATYVGRN